MGLRMSCSSDVHPKPELLDTTDVSRSSTDQLCSQNSSGIHSRPSGCTWPEGNSLHKLMDGPIIIDNIDNFHSADELGSHLPCTTDIYRSFSNQGEGSRYQQQPAACSSSGQQPETGSIPTTGDFYVRESETGSILTIGDVYVRDRQYFEKESQPLLRPQDLSVANLRQALLEPRFGSSVLLGGCAGAGRQYFAYEGSGQYIDYIEYFDNANALGSPLPCTTDVSRSLTDHLCSQSSSGIHSRPSGCGWPKGNSLHKLMDGPIIIKNLDSADALGSHLPCTTDVDRSFSNQEDGSRCQQQPATCSSSGQQPDVPKLGCKIFVGDCQSLLRF